MHLSIENHCQVSLGELAQARTSYHYGIDFLVNYVFIISALCFASSGIWTFINRRCKWNAELKRNRRGYVESVEKFLSNPISLKLPKKILSRFVIVATFSTLADKAQPINAWRIQANNFICWSHLSLVTLCSVITRIVAQYKNRFLLLPSTVGRAACLLLVWSALTSGVGAVIEGLEGGQSTDDAALSNLLDDKLNGESCELNQSRIIGLKLLLF